MPKPAKPISRKLSATLAISLLIGAGSASAMSFTFSRIAGTDNGYSALTLPGFVLGTIFFRGIPPSGSQQVSLSGNSSGSVSTGGSGGGSGSGGGAYRSTDPNTGQTGIFTDVGGTVTAIVPFNSGFSALGEPDDNDGTVVFRATDANGEEGIYRNDDSANDPAGKETTVANQDTPADPANPDPNDTLDSFGDPVTDNGEVAFKATADDGVQAIYTADPDGTDPDGTLTKVVDTDTTVPDADAGTTTFDDLGDPSLDSGQVAFSATNSDGTSGLYIASPDPSGSVNIETVIDLNDELDGKNLSSLVLSQDAIDNGSLTFLAKFDNGHEAIYLATPLGDILLPQGAPTPATAALMLTGLGLIGFKRRRSNTVRR